MIHRTSYVRAPDWPAPVRYAVAVTAAVAAAAVRGLMSSLWGDDLPFLTFFPAIVLSAWAGGFWPGIVTTVLGAGLANYFWMAPFHSLKLWSVNDLIGLLFFIAIGVLISALSETMYRGRRRLEGLLHSIDEGFVVFDPEWRYRYVNDRAAELLRQPASSMVGKAIWDLFPDIVGTEIETHLRRAAGGSAPVEFETFYRPNERWFRVRVFPTSEGFSALVEDTTERKHVEEASSRLAAIVRSSDEAIVGKDLDGIITAWNPAAERLFGFSAQEAIGRSIRMIVPADRQAEEDDVLSRLRRGETIEHMETVRIRKDGTPIDVALTVSPIRGADGRIIGVSKIARDIGERMRAETERTGLLAAEQTARARAESAERRATLLAESSAALSASLDSTTTLRTVSQLVVPRFADWCIIDLVARDNSLERVAVSAGGADTEALLSELQGYAPDWSSPQPAAEVLRSRKTIIIPEVTEETLVSTARDARHLEIMRRLRPRSAIAVPMATRQRVVGAITLVRNSPGQPYDGPDIAMAEELARRAALAVDNATLYSEATRRARRRRTPTARRTSSSRCCPTSCARRSTPSSAGRACSQIGPARRRTHSARARRHRAQRPRPGAADRRPAGRLADHQRARCGSTSGRWTSTAVRRGGARRRPAGRRGQGHPPAARARPARRARHRRPGPPAAGRLEPAR